MDTDLIILREYCEICGIDPSFIILLHEDGLIEIQFIEGERYLLPSQLPQIERYTRWHYDLSINVEGISVIDDLLERMNNMQKEIAKLRQELRVFGHNPF